MYETLETIGRGSFGLIRKVKRISDGKILAQKEINYGQMSQLEKQQLVNEVNILQELKHPNIIRYYERILDTCASKIYIITEYCDGGDLASLISACREQRTLLPEDTIWCILAQLVLALHECHYGSKRGHGTILHRDIKPENGN
jgi:serine/threonine protein kinase